MPRASNIKANVVKARPNSKQAKVDSKGNGKFITAYGKNIGMKNKPSPIDMSNKGNGGVRANSGRPKGKSNATHMNAMLVLREKIDKLGIQLKHEADPIIGLLMFFWDGNNPWIERREAAAMVLPHIYPKFGTVEGMPDLNISQQNNTQINLNDLALEDKRQLLMIGSKLNREKANVIEGEVIEEEKE